MRIGAPRSHPGKCLYSAGVDDVGETAGPADREAEIASVCRAVSDLLRAQEILLGQRLG